MSFIDAQINTDPAAMIDAAIDNLSDTFAANGITGWTPNEGALEIILLSVIAQLMADAANVASQMPAAAFRKLGTDLFGVPYIKGTTATVFSTWTATDTVGHTIPAGTYVTIGGLGFYVQSDTAIPQGLNTVSEVLLVAAEVGSSYNGSSGPVATVDAIDWLQSVDIIGQTSGGLDPESDDDYQDRLKGLLELQAPRPITASDYQTFVLSFNPASGTDQQEIGRAVAIDGYNPDAGAAITADVTTDSDTLLNALATENVGPGTVLSGGGIPTGTVVLENDGTSLRMSNLATSSASQESITVTGLYNQARCVAVFVAAADGTALNADTLAAAQAWLETFREVNFVISVLAPAYTTVFVNFQIKCLPDADPVGTVAAAQTALLSYLSPTGFGVVGNTSIWVNDPVVRYNKLVGIIENVTGVDYVTTLVIGTSAGNVQAVDVPIFGPAALVQSDVTTINGTAA
jgi:hypothetical protein